MVDKTTGEIIPESDITNIESEFYENKEPPVFTVGKCNIFNLISGVFEDVGKAVCAGILDFSNANPISRLPKSQYKNLEGVRKAIEKHVDDVWGLDEMPEEKEDIRPAYSLPRVALLGPKKKVKTHQEKIEEKKEQREKDRKRIQKIRQGYLKEMKERREKESLVQKIQNFNTQNVNKNISNFIL